MAIKTFCDYCQAEIHGTEGGLLKYIDTSSISMSSKTMEMKDQYREVAKILCDKCLNKVKKVL